MKPSTWLILFALLGSAYLLSNIGNQREAAKATKQLRYDTVAVSDGLSEEARALNLERDLDVALLPALAREVVREAAGKGLKEQAFLEFALQGISNRVRAISTIDLNQDEIVDPILVKPEPSQQESYVLLSIRVPTPESYPLPKASDRSAWSKVESLEVATISITLDQKALTVQAQGNKHVYPPAQQQHYVARDTGSSFLQTYFAIRMLDWMFFPRFYGFWGPGFGYGFYQPTPVRTQRQTRSARSAGYSRSSASRTSAVRGRSSGQAPRSAYARSYANTPPRSLNRLRASQSFRPSGATASAPRSGGFGRNATTQRASATSPNRSVRSSSRGFGGFGRGTVRRSFGGGGFRGGK